MNVTTRLLPASSSEAATRPASALYKAHTNKYELFVCAAASVWMDQIEQIRGEHRRVADTDRDRAGDSHAFLRNRER